MRQLTITLTDQVAATVDELAARFAITPEVAAAEVIRNLHDFLNPGPSPDRAAVGDEQFRRILADVLAKNAELHRRLAQH